MRVIILAAAVMGMMTTGLAQAELLSSLTSTTETILEPVSEPVLDPILGTSSETTLETSTEITSEPTLESTSETDATVWIPPTGLLSDDTIASIGVSADIDTTIVSADIGADLNMNQIPAPGTIVLLGIGLMALVTTRRHRKTR